MPKNNDPKVTDEELQKRLSELTGNKKLTPKEEVEWMQEARARLDKLNNNSPAANPPKKPLTPKIPQHKKMPISQPQVDVIYQGLERLNELVNDIAQKFEWAKDVTQVTNVQNNSLQEIKTLSTNVNNKAAQHNKGATINLPGIELSGPPIDKFNEHVKQAEDFVNKAAKTLVKGIGKATKLVVKKSAELTLKAIGKTIKKLGSLLINKTDAMLNKSHDNKVPVPQKDQLSSDNKLKRGR